MNIKSKTKFLNKMIAISAGLAILSAGYSAGYKYISSKKSNIFLGLSLANTMCLGTCVWKKDKSREQ